MRRKMERLLAAGLASALVLGLAACGGAPATSEAPADEVQVEETAPAEEAAEEVTDESAVEEEAVADKGTIIVGSKGFTENLILSELYALALEDDGYTVKRQFEVSNAVINEALLEGEIDIYPEYTGTALMTILEQPMETDPEVVYDTVKTMYAEQFDLAVLDMCAANDGNGLAMRADVAAEYGITNISDLQANAENISFGCTADFYEREDGLAGLSEVYGEFNFKEENSFDNALKYDVMAAGEADCVPAYTTDAQLSSDEFILLEDDLNFWPPYNIVPVARQDVLDQNPGLADIINVISDRIDTETMTALNARVDLDLEEYDDVAAEFYAEMKAR